MLFVFGYRATKIRSKKISVLLHKSENHQNVRSCTVEVHFIKINDLPGDDYEKIPGSKLVIARTAFADNTSFYTINGKRSQFKDVANILRSHGIDLVHNRFLILQGEVEQIAMMKPKAQTEHDTGMLEYLEDIIGTTRYKVNILHSVDPIHKLGTKLEQLTEERLERLNRMKVAEKERDTLKEPMSEAIEFLTIENKKTVVQNSRYQKQIFDLENKLKALEKEKEEHDSKMEELKEKLKEAHEKRTKKEKEMNVKHKEIESLRAQKEKLSEAFRLIENRATRLKEEISQTNKRRKKAIEAKKQEEAKIIELEALPAKNSKEIEELTLVEKKLVPERERQQTVVEEAVVNLQSETKELQDSKDNLSDQLIGLKRDKYDIAKAELDLYLSNEQKEIAKLDKLKENLQKTVEQLKKRKVELADLDLKVSAGEQQLEAARTELNSIKAKEPKALQELHRLRATLDEKKSSMQARTSRSKVLDFIMRQKQEGHLPGVFGRLGDLGGIDAKYDVAISTACGALDHIVVDTIQTGMACVNALKRNDVGRANFIALEKQEHLRNVYRRPIKTPENVPRLFDLITVEDDRVRPAFYFALRDTLVADDLQQSIRVAYGATRFRVVTLTGEIIETSGTMSGGGNQVMRGRMGRSVAIATSDQLNTSSGGNVNIGSMEKRVAELQETISGYHRRQAQLEDTVATLSRNIERWKMDCESFKFEIEVIFVIQKYLVSETYTK
ncbi:hypothetical protein AAG570_005953 [Ranatra chinensis]|uniref:SMC hinge domain-containing protein n=1 Tax=Ranatra chinensis TaxID=642074 RepID=A0ABD0YBN9_9HEMI